MTNNTMMKKNLTFMAFTALLLFSACSGSVRTKEADKVEAKPRVKIQQVTSQLVDQTQEYTATVKADIVNNIAPTMAMRIENILVEVGDRVKKGQKLVRMDLANLKQMKFQLDNQKLEFSRIDELYKVGGVSKSEWDAARMALDVQETSYKNLLENTSLLSPINGIITARNYDKGDLYSPSKPVLVVERISPVKLLINVSEKYFTKVKKGQDVKVTLDVYGDEVFNAKVSLVYPTINPQTRTFPVEVKLRNNDQRVRSGMFARATLNFGSKDHVVVPDLAVIKQPGSGDRYIYVYKDGKVSYNKVVLGRRMGAKYELVSGVENGSQVVIAGQTRLADGREVEVEK